jgi:hypothetical protein
MPTTKSNTINQYCSVCKEHFDLEVVKQGSTKDVIWLKCPGCQGFLPHTPDDSDEDDDGRARREAQSEMAIEDLDVESAKEYSDDQVFEVGDIVHHRSWNDFGKVVLKEKLPGNRNTIWVQFLRQGRVQLLEGVE